MKKFFHLFLATVGIFFFGIQTGLASPLYVVAPDTIAGYGNDIEVKNAPANSSVTVFIKNTVGEISKNMVQINRNGTGFISFPSDKTLNAGKYSVVAVREGLSFNDGPLTFFEVFSDSSSPKFSTLQSENISVSVGNKSKVIVSLKDKYGNVVADHRVSLVSSRSEDTIIPLGNGHSDNNGKITFSVSSELEGNSSFTATDITDSVTIQKRKNILFYSSKSSRNIGSSDFKASIFSNQTQADSNFSGEVSSFAIDFPEEVTADSDENYLTVSALDSEGHIIKNFDKTILVRIPTDSNAQLPGENGLYLFTKKDQGEFTFPRAVVFSEIGTHQLEVFLYDTQTKEVNVNIYGKKEIEVVENTGIPKENPNADKIEILFPTNKSEFSSATVSVRGKGLPDTDVKIFVDDVPVDTIEVDGSGIFTTSLDDLEDGKHTIYAMQMEGKRETSQEVQFFTDSIPPTFIEGTFSPHSVAPKGLVTLTIRAEKGLKTMEAFWGDDSEFLTEQEEGLYQLTFSAPEKEGKYDIEIVLTDTLSNTTREKISPQLEVFDPKKTSTLILSGEFNTQSKTIDLSWTVENLAGSPSDTILYIIKSGKSKDFLQKRKSVAGSKNKASLAFDEDGEKYFFSLTPVGANGNEGADSNIISIEIPKISPPTATPTPTPTPISIPETWDFSVTSAPDSLDIRWDEKKGTSEYRILYGVSSENYPEKKEVSGNILAEKLSNLIPGVRYYIRVQGIDSLGNISYDYGEKIGIPGENNFHPAPSSAPKEYPQWMSETGPKFFILMGSLFLFFGGIMMIRRKN